jgi:hypothetical protein
MQFAVQRWRPDNKENRSEDMAADDESDFDAHSEGHNRHFRNAAGCKCEKECRHRRVDEHRAQDRCSKCRHEHNRRPRKPLDNRGADLMPSDTGEAGTCDAAYDQLHDRDEPGWWRKLRRTSAMDGRAQDQWYDHDTTDHLERTSDNVAKGGAPQQN